jgi:hypothetical protein
MSERNTILTTLEAEIKQKINSSNNYNSDLMEVKRGIAVFEEFTSKPALTFWCEKDETEEGQFAGADRRELTILFYGFCDTDGYNANVIHNLLDDLLYFIQNDFTYKDDVYVGDATIYEGGATDPALVFELQTKIKYERTIASL